MVTMIKTLRASVLATIVFLASCMGAVAQTTVDTLNPAVSPQLTDEFWGWQDAQDPHTRKFTLQQIIGQTVLSAPLYSFTNVNGTTTGVLNSQSQNRVLASPNGSSGVPAFRGLIGADLPNPGASSLGGVQSLSGATHNFLTGISTSGVPQQAQPSFSDLSGSLGCPQIPALTGDVTTSAGSCATTVARVNGVSYGASPSINTVPVVTGSNLITYEAVPNAVLANSSVTIGSTTVALGATASSISGLSLVSPALGTPASGVATNLTGIPGSRLTNTPTFQASKGGTQQSGITDSLFTKITFTTGVFDVGGYYDTTNSKYLPLVAGKYRFKVVMQVGGTTLGLLDQGSDIIGIYKNGSIVSRMQRSASGSGQQCFDAEIILSMNGSTDFIEAYAFIQTVTGGTDAFVSGSTVATYFEGEFIGS